MNVETLCPDRDRGRVQQVWQELANEVQPRYCLTWPWVEVWLDTLPPYAKPQLVVLANQGERLGAFFLSRRTLVRHGVLRSRTLFINQTGYSDLDRLTIEYNGWLCRPGARFRLAEVLAKLGDWDELVLSRCDEKRPPAVLLDQPLDGVQLTQMRLVASPVVDLEAVRAEGDYLRLLSSSTRASIRRAGRFYAQRGPLQFEVARDLDEASDIYSELAELHGRSWRSRGEEGAFAEPYFDLFHRELIRRRMVMGEIQLVRLRAGGQTLACLYNFIYGGVVEFYQSGFTYEDDNRAKPGFVAHAESVAYNAAAGHRVYDFLAGDTRYKKELATHENRLVSVVLQRPSLVFGLESQLRRVRHFMRALHAERGAKPR